MNTTSYEDGRAYGIVSGGLEEMKQYAYVLVWNCYIASLPEEECQETVLKKIKTVKEE